MTGRDAEREQLAAALAQADLAHHEFGTSCSCGYNVPQERLTVWMVAMQEHRWGARADVVLPVVDRIANERAAAARVEAMNDVLHWLSEDVTWAGPVLGNDVALGIDHARRRVVEMRAGRWPVATAEDPS